MPRPRRPNSGPESAVAAVPYDLLGMAMANAANAIFLTDHQGHLIWANEAFCKLSGYSLDEAIGRTPSLVKSGMQSDLFYAELWRTLLAGKAWRGQMVERHKSGAHYTVNQTITPLRDEHGVITHFVAIQENMTLQSGDQKREHFLAYHDTLTGLPNRALFSELARQAISQAQLMEHALALLYLDLDRFKPVNDRYGHDVGDRLLLAVSERLHAAIRKTDTAARLGGDEFGILLPQLPDADTAVALADKLVESISQPFAIEEKELHIGISIGLAIFPNDGDTVDELMQRADAAMYEAKRQGGSGYQGASRRH